MVNGVNLKINVDDLLLSALKEDITSEDVSTNAILRERQPGSAQLIAKQDGILAGLGVFERIFTLLDDTAEFQTSFQDGDSVKKSTLVGTLTGDMRALLSGERTALNYLQRMSGIATMTHRYVKCLEGSKTRLLDTRKTTPNMRIFEKYAVKVGGGVNHRYNLSDGIMLKDNHIGAAGGIMQAVQRAREYAPFIRKIEVETETLEMVQQALDAGADIIMLDNMDDETMKKAVAMIGNRAQTECSGNVTEERLKSIAAIGVDFVSCGALTHSVRILDLSLKNMKPLA